MEMREYGFKPPIITESHYVKGDGRLFGVIELNPTGNWEKWLPKYEAQAELYETYACTCYGALNQIETLHNFLYNTFEAEPNYSERFNYNLAKITPPGTDPQITYETIRKNGLIQGLLLMPNTYKDFCTPRPMTEPYLTYGKDWLSKYHIDHDWVLTGIPKPEVLRTELKKSPLGVSVTAWYEENGVYVDKGQPNNHWCLLYKMDDKYYYVFDSYDHSKKTLPLSHNIYYAKRIVLYKNDPGEINKNYLVFLKSIVQFLYEYIKSTTKVGAEIIGAIFSPKQGD